MGSQDVAIRLEPGERIDSFKREGIQLIQSDQYFNMSLDAILLADYINLPKKRHFRYIDFCSGNGVIPLLLSHKTSEQLFGIEIQAPLVEMAQRSIALNKLQDQVQIFQGDVNEIDLEQWRGMDIISCNPPYFLVKDSKEVHQRDSFALARHELSLSLDQWLKQASRMLKTKGKLFFVHRPDRLDDIIENLLKYHFAIHRMKFVHPKVGARANIVLVEAIYYGGRHGVKIDPPLIVHNEDNSYTAEMMAIYYA